MTYVIFFLFVLAIIFFWQSNRQQKAAGLPGGRVIYTDTHAWGKVEKPLFYAALELTGKPDYLIEKNGQIIPVEVKSSRAPERHRLSIFQLASTPLVDKTYGSVHQGSSNIRTVIILPDYTRESIRLIDLFYMKEDDGRGMSSFARELPALCVADQKCVCIKVRRNHLPSRYNRNSLQISSLNGRGHRAS
jgi:CRISPR-associated exonuclease Cas4